MHLYVYYVRVEVIQNVCVHVYWHTYMLPVRVYCSDILYNLYTVLIFTVFSCIKIDMHLHDAIYRTQYFYVE